MSASTACPGMPVLVLAYETPSGNHIPLARIDDRRMVTAAANRAIDLARQRASSFADTATARLERSEARRLADILGILTAK
jgi:hypothetical protein